MFLYVNDILCPKVLIAMTDGISKDSVVTASRYLRFAGVRILALGLGKRFKRSQLIQMTNNRRNVFSANFRDLNSVVRSIKRTACGGKFKCSYRKGFFPGKQYLRGV